MATRQDEHNGDLHLTLVMLAYHISVKESTGCTTFELVSGREARLLVDVMYGLPSQTPPTEVNCMILSDVVQPVRVHQPLHLLPITAIIRYRRCKRVTDEPVSTNNGIGG